MADKRLFEQGRPDDIAIDTPNTGRSLLPEKVEDRENVGQVRPEDYPLQDRLDSDATGYSGVRAKRRDPQGG